MSQLIKLYSDSLDGRSAALAADALAGGEIIIFPTDTFYSLGCDALNQRAIERLCRIKGLDPERNLLSIICSDISQASDYARIDNRAYRIMKEYLPGPFTFILPASNRLPKVFKGRKTVGIRIPRCNIARSLASETGNPVLATSVPFTEEFYEYDSAADLIAERYASDARLIIDNGSGAYAQSTIVDLTDSASPEVIREGIGDFTI